MFESNLRCTAAAPRRLGRRPDGDRNRSNEFLVSFSQKLEGKSEVVNTREVEKTTMKKKKKEKRDDERREKRGK